MCGLNSANAPEFFLHHCFIDKIWANWQEMGDSYMNVYFHRIRKYLISTRYRPRHFVDNTRMGRGRRQCVLYDDPRHPEYNRILDRLGQMTLRQLHRIRRHSFTPATRRQLKRLGIRKRERNRAMRLMRKELQPQRQQRSETGMNEMEIALGFKMIYLRRPLRSKRNMKVKENAMWDRWRSRHRNTPAIYPTFDNTTTFE